jgi:biotin transport system substrate-specific component
MVLAGVFAALIAISSLVAIPIGPVPHTLQVFFIMLAGTVLGSRWGAISVLIWVLLGLFGVPVFAQGKAGVAVLVGPTGGFLLGFIFCAFLVGLILERISPNYVSTFLAMLLGLAVIYIVGLAGVLVSFAYFLHKPMTIEGAFSIAVVPFLPFDVVKAALAAFLGVKVRKALIQAGLIQESNRMRG